MRFNTLPQNIACACAAMLACWSMGCTSPRSAARGPVLKPPAYAQSPTAPRGSLVDDRPSGAALRSEPAARSPELAIESSELERRVARYTAEPSRLFRTTGATRSWKYIILHHSGEANGSLASIDRFHRETNGWDECGYHFVIGNGTESGDGEIEVGSRWPKQKHGAHTKPQGVQEYNERGIGICLVGNMNQQPPTPKQVEATRRLVAFLQQRYGVAPRGVTTHGDVHGSHTECPGKLFPYDRLIPRG
jgi:N-acetyl-anhydromuramyl-L-alanine amidase AmpD